jgi:hypothetical protein
LSGWWPRLLVRRLGYGTQHRNFCSHDPRATGNWRRPIFGIARALVHRGSARRGFLLSSR